MLISIFFYGPLSKQIGSCKYGRIVVVMKSGLILESAYVQPQNHTALLSSVLIVLRRHIAVSGSNLSSHVGQ